MTNTEKAIIWNLIEKYDNTLRNLSDSLSRILSGKNTDEDYIEVFRNYQRVELNDETSIDSILGDRIMMIIN